MVELYPVAFSPSVALPRKIFRAYDIRGDIAFLTPHLLSEIGFALASVYQAATKTIEGTRTQVVVGYDARLTSAGYASCLVRTLVTCGIDVIEISQVSSPLLYFTALNYQGHGVMITASHNPINDNGMKWLVQGRPPSPADIQHVADLIEQRRNRQESPYQGEQATADSMLQSTSILSSASSAEALAAYQTFMAREFSACNFSHAPVVCIDGLHGSAGAIAVAILQHLGSRVVALHCTPNGNFPLGAPDPSDAKRLQSLCQQVVQHQAGLGLALDGDGDRLVVVDEQGKIVSPDVLMQIFAKIVLTDHPNAEIVCDVKCSSALNDTVQRYGGRLTMIRTGSSFLRNYLLTHNDAVFGGEFAGHYVFDDGRGQGFDDGLYAGLRLLEWLVRCQQPLSVILSEFGTRIATEDLYVACHGIPICAIEQQIIAAIGHREDLRICQVDGIRVDSAHGFGLIRASNTGDYFTLRFDASHRDDLRQIADVFVHALQPNFIEIANAIRHTVQQQLNLP